MENKNTCWPTCNFNLMTMKGLLDLEEEILRQRKRSTDARELRNLEEDHCYVVKAYQDRAAANMKNFQRNYIRENKDIN